MSWLLKVTHIWVTFFKLLDKDIIQRKERLDGRQGKKDCTRRIVICFEMEKRAFKVLAFKEAGYA